MIKFAVCDDNKTDRDYIHKLVRQFLSTCSDDFDYCISRFSDAASLLSDINEGNSYDILILDVLLPGCDGIELAKKIRQQDADCMIIFLSVSSEFAISSYDVGAFYYLLKPIRQDKLSKVLSKALSKLHNKSARTLGIKTPAGIEGIRYCDILYIESMDHKQILHKKDGGIVIFYARISDIFKTLSVDRCFVMPHRSYIINLNFASAISSKDIILLEKIKIPVSKKNYPHIKKVYLDFLFMTSGEDSRIE